MASNIFLLQILLAVVSSDRLRFHLENLVDWNVSPCDDFYHHVCSQEADPREFFINRSSTIFQEAIKKFQPDAIRNSPIEYDRQQGILNNQPFNASKYAKIIKKRCTIDLICYLEELRYFASHLEDLEIPFREVDYDYDENSVEEMVDKMIETVTDMIIAIINYASADDFDPENNLLTTAYNFHTFLQTRILMMEFMQTNNSFTDFHEIKEAAEIMKDKMIDNINSTSWLYGDEISDSIRLKIIERVESITVDHDFDDFDKNLTALRKLNRDFNRHYFSVNRHETNFIMRIAKYFQWGAFFNTERKIVTILAPLVYKSAFHSDVLSEPFITYFVLGHELYHSLFSFQTPTLLTLFDKRRECISDHYKKTCTKFAIGSCGSGDLTITEDAPDLESYRTAHALLRDRYSEEKLNAKIFGLEITLEQAFFYYAASGWCEIDRDRTEEEAEDVHSANNIRVNAAFSLMPEFSNAFGCKKEDPMFVAESDSCYVFGPKSKLQFRHSFPFYDRIFY